MLLLVIAYPLLSHLATVRQNLWLQWAALICLVAIPLYPQMRAMSPPAWGWWLGISAALYGLVFFGGGQYALFLPPVLLPIALGMLFGESLLPGRTPLITRIARAARGGHLAPELAHYTRMVTMAWTALLFTIAASAALLAIFAPLHAWSLFTNLISYVILGVAFPLEYLWRRIRYRHLEHPGFVAHIKLIARTNYRKA
ncbi:MAG TPA: hypothetical protein VFB36_02180 [Nevskiaceae bacterium]|nr:hypothetical protein [Nevskiaceae bacterium]